MLVKALLCAENMNQFLAQVLIPPPLLAGEKHICQDAVLTRTQTHTHTHKNAQSCSIYAQEAEMNDGEWVASLKARC